MAVTGRQGSMELAVDDSLTKQSCHVACAVRKGTSLAVAGSGAKAGGTGTASVEDNRMSQADRQDETRPPGGKGGVLWGGIMGGLY